MNYIDIVGVAGSIPAAPTIQPAGFLSFPMIEASTLATFRDVNGRRTTA